MTGAPNARGDRAVKVGVGRRMGGAGINGHVKAIDTTGREWDDCDIGSWVAAFGIGHTLKPLPDGTPRNRVDHHLRVHQANRTRHAREDGLIKPPDSVEATARPDVLGVA